MAMTLQTSVEQSHKKWCLLLCLLSLPFARLVIQLVSQLNWSPAQKFMPPYLLCVRSPYDTPYQLSVFIQKFSYHRIVVATFWLTVLSYCIKMSIWWILVCDTCYWPHWNIYKKKSFHGLGKPHEIYCTLREESARSEETDRKPRQLMLAVIF